MLISSLKGLVAALAGRRAARTGRLQHAVRRAGPIVRAYRFKHKCAAAAARARGPAATAAARDRAGRIDADADAPDRCARRRRLSRPARRAHRADAAAALGDAGRSGRRAACRLHGRLRARPRRLHRQPGRNRRQRAGDARRLRRRGGAERYRGRPAGALRGQCAGRQHAGAQADHRAEPSRSARPGHRAAAADAGNGTVDRRRGAPGRRLGRRRTSGRRGDDHRRLERLAAPHRGRLRGALEAARPGSRRCWWWPTRTAT